jgi:hypothetical protein
MKVKPMAPSSSYRDDLLNYIEVLNTQTRLLQIYFAGQKEFVKLQYYTQLECVCSRFAEFRLLVEQLDIEDDLQVNQQMEAIESARKRLMLAVDSLISELRRTRKTGHFFREPFRTCFT